MFEQQTVTKQGTVSEPCEITVTSSHVRVVVAKSQKVTEFHLKSLKSITSGAKYDLQFGNGITVLAKGQTEAEALLNQICVAIKEAQPKRFEATSEDAFTLNIQWSFANNAPVGDATPCGSYGKSYAFACAYYQVPVREDVLWLAQEIWQLESGRCFNLNVIPECSVKDILCLLDALQFNGYFESLIIQDTKLISDHQQVLISVLKANKRFKNVSFQNCSLSKEFVGQFGELLRSNSMVSVDLSGNNIDDSKVCTQLAQDLKTLPKGLLSLKLADCQISKKTFPGFINAFVRQDGKNQSVALTDTLQYLDLSGNAVGQDGQLLLCELLAQPNVVQSLVLNNCQITNVDLLFGALMRGSTNSLQFLDVSGNKFGNSESGTHSFDQFIKSAQSLKQLNLSSTKLSAVMLKTLLNGLYENYAIQELQLILKGNEFGQAEANVFGQQFGQLINVVAVDLSEIAFDDDSLIHILEGLSKNCKLHTVVMNKCFTKTSMVSGKKSLKLSFDLSALLKVPNLKALSIADNQFKQSAKEFVTSLVNTKSLTLKKFDLSGNALGDELAVSLARYVLTSNSISEIECGDNNFSFVGWQALVKSAGYSKTLQSLKIPHVEVAQLSKFDKQRAEQLLTNLSVALNGNSSARVPVAGGSSRQSKVATVFAGNKDLLTLTQQQTLDKLSLDLNNHIAQLQDQTGSVSPQSSPALNQAKLLKTELDSFSSQVTQISYLLDAISNEQLNGLKLASSQQGRAVFNLLNSFTTRAVDQVLEQLLKAFTGFLEPADEYRRQLKAALTDESALKESSVASVMSNFLQIEVHSKCLANYDAIIDKAKNYMFDRIVKKSQEVVSTSSSSKPVLRPRTDSQASADKPVAAAGKSDLQDNVQKADQADTPSKGRKITTQQNNVNAELMGKLFKSKNRKPEVDVTQSEPASAGSQSSLSGNMAKVQTISSAPAAASKSVAVSVASSQVNSPQLLHTVNKDRVHLKAKRKPPTRNSSIAASVASGEIADSEPEIKPAAKESGQPRMVSSIAETSRPASMVLESSPKPITKMQQNIVPKSNTQLDFTEVKSSNVNLVQPQLVAGTQDVPSATICKDSISEQPLQVSPPPVAVDKPKLQDDPVQVDVKPEQSKQSNEIDVKSLVDQMMEEAASALARTSNQDQGGSQAQSLPSKQSDVVPVLPTNQSNMAASEQINKQDQLGPALILQPVQPVNSVGESQTDSPSLPPKPTQAVYDEAVKSQDNQPKSKASSMFKPPTLAQIGSALRGSQKSLNVEEKSVKPEPKEDPKRPELPKIEQKKPDVVKREPIKPDVVKQTEPKKEDTAPPILAPKPKTYGKPMLPTNVFDEMKKNMKPLQKSDSTSPTK